MKTFIIYSCIFCLSINGFTQQKLQAINPILLDQSFVAAFGTGPDAETSEQVRIQTHLFYAEQLLRATPVPNLTAVQQTRRRQILDLLHEYLVAGNFPTNKDYPDERRPCFIDAAGRICAVGYLIEQTKGRQLAEAINEQHQYDFLFEMHEPVIEEWAKEFGLKLEECAMVQPAYGYLPATHTYVDIKTGYGVSSGLIGGSNIAISLAQFTGRWKNNASLSYIGLVTGAGQVIIGIANIKKSQTEYSLPGPTAITSYKAQNNLSYANIALGTSTLVTSTLNLLMNKKNKEPRNAFNLYSYPNYMNSLTMGLSFTRNI